MKTCSKCKKRKRESSFNKKRGSTQHACRRCQKKYFAAYYARNRKEVIATNMARKTALAQELREKVAEMKAKPCADCKGRFSPVAMDFDHVRGVKLGAIAAMCWSGSGLPRLLAEISKCEVVCACCHRIRTAKRMEIRDGLKQDARL